MANLLAVIHIIIGHCVCMYICSDASENIMSKV